MNILGIDEVDPDEPIRVHVETRRLRPDCLRYEMPAVIKDRPRVQLVDLPAFGRPVRLVWRKHRAGRWVTFQVGKHGRTVNEVAPDLGCDWHQTHVTNGPTQAAMKRIKGSLSDSDGSSTTGSAPCSTPGNPTGTYSPPFVK